MGIEWSTESFLDKYDSLREAGNVIGSAGKSSSGNKEHLSVFGELSIPLIDTINMNLAARYDDYVNIGDYLSPSVKMHWEPVENLIVSASYNEGFKIPAFTSLYSARVESTSIVTDLLACENQQIEFCPSTTARVFTGGNSELEAEESKGFKLGLAWEPIENIVFSIDYFDIDIDKILGQLSASTILSLEREGINLPSGTGVVRDSTGLTINAGLANIASLNVKGMDLKLMYQYDAANIGTFSSVFNYSKIFDYIFTSLPAPLGTPAEQLDNPFIPDERATLITNWNNGDHTVTLNSYWISSTPGRSSAKIPSFVNHNLTYNYHTAWDADIFVGIRNLADREPSIDSSLGWSGNKELSLYDVYGRSPFLSYKQRF